LKEQKAEIYDKQLEKTSLFFSNPLWLDYVLNKEAVSEEHQTGTNNPGTEESPLITDDSLSPEDKLPSTQPPAPVPEKTIREQDVPDVKEHNDHPPVPSLVGMDDSSLDDEPGLTAVDEESNEPAVEEEEELSMKPFHFEPVKDSDINSSLTFEPYHTVDYFASQGIKMSQNEKPKDRFEQQLKSFTQWLKTIKEVSVADIPKDTGVDADEKVISLAEHSIEDREIVTETMAEVWVKQGNRQKAIEVYNKLSLQNPAKSSYFAGLIEQLKH